MTTARDSTALLCRDCKRNKPYGHSQLCQTCYGKRPKCNSTMCSKKVAKRSNGQFFTFCLGCACKKNGCKNGHTKDSEYCRDCLTTYASICIICKKNQSNMFQTRCQECYDNVRCVACERLLSENEQGYCSMCQCIVTDCQNQKLQDSKFCADCYMEAKCQECDRFRANDTVYCFQHLKTTYPQCKGCENHVGKNEKTGEFYHTCRDCRCQTRGCTNVKNASGICDECATKPACAAVGCHRLVKTGDRWCTLCDEEWISNSKTKCHTDYCTKYIPKRFSFCQDCEKKNGARQDNN
jgi:hypothetical protein